MPLQRHEFSLDSWPQPGASSHGGGKLASVCIVSLRGSGFFAQVEPSGSVPFETYTPSNHTWSVRGTSAQSRRGGQCWG